MNKKIKKVVASIVTVSAFCTIVPTANLLTIKAYASTSDTQLKSIFLSDGDIDFSSSTYSYTIEVTKSVDEIRITAKPKNEDSTVEIDGTTVDEDDKYRETVDLDKGKNIIKIKVTDEDDDKTRTYTLKIYRGTHSKESDDTYLDSLKVEGTDIDLSKDKSSYDVNVKESIDEVTIKAVPNDKDNIVKIDGSTVYDDDDYEKKVDLKKGKNTFEIKIKDDDNDEVKTYTLNVFRENNTSTNANTNTSSNITTKTNQWVTVNGQMQYNDGNGNPLKNTWFWDSNVGKYYYLDYNGYKKTGWFYNNSRWYYLDGSGAMLKGWQYINGAWYYLDDSGAMKTGWFRSYNGTWYYLNYNGKMRTGWMIDNGKYYYLNSDGSMAHDTVVSGFRLGSDGAWVGR